MVEEEKKVDKKPVEVGLVRLTQESGVGIQLENGEIIDLSGTDFGSAQAFAHIVKLLSELKKNIG